MTKYMKKEVRKEQIKKVAIELFTKKGYKKTSVQDIVDRANFSKGGFYNCFPSKEALFKEILVDGMALRYEKVRAFKSNAKDMDKKSIVIETLLEKILDYNDYKKLYATLMIEMSLDESFYQFYMDSFKGLLKEFLEFCEQEGFADYKKVVSDEFNALISSLILGTEIYRQHDNQKYRALLRELLTAYFDKLDVFKE